VGCVSWWFTAHHKGLNNSKKGELQMAEQNNNLENFLVSVESNLATTLAAKAAALPDGFQAAKFQQNCVAMLKGIKKQIIIIIDNNFFIF